jgi:prophage antirepressor-like protein
MSAEIIPFDFEEQAVRVIMRGEEPWFVAADVCRVLDIKNPSDATSRLDDDERDTVNLNTLGLTEGIRGNPNATVISESGLYALVVRSDKPEAKRFRKWITAEVLPAIRRTGRYEHPAAVEAPARPEGEIAGMPIREAELWLQMVREARLTRGNSAAVSIWDGSPLPRLSPVRGASVTREDGAEALAHLNEVVAVLVSQARNRSPEAIDALTGFGCRVRDEGLFVGNPNHPGVERLFAGSRFTGGRYRAALLALPGVEVAGPASIGNVTCRGIVLPFSLIAGVEDV